MKSDQRMDDVFEFLGAPAARAPLHSLDEVFLHQATWECGCALDYVHESGGAYDWHVCDKHGERTRIRPKEVALFIAR